MSNSDLSNISAASLRRAADISEKIESLREELAGILGGSSTSSAPASTTKRKYNRRASTEAKSKAAPAKKKKKRARKPLSPEALANIRAAQAKRWAKVRAGKK